MRFPRVRSTVRRMITLTATLAVGLQTFFGVACLVAYRAELDAVVTYKSYSKQARAEGRNELADEWEREAQEQAGTSRWVRAQAVTTLSLVGLGIFLGGAGLVIKSRSVSGGAANIALVRPLGSACLTVATIVLAGFALGAASYVGFLLCVLNGSD